MDVNRLVALLSGDFGAYERVQVVELVALLLLFDPQRAYVLIGIPLPGAFKVGMSWKVDPLMKEAIEVAARCLFDSAGQIASFHRTLGVAFGIEAQGAEEISVADLMAEHVQDAPAFFVKMAIEEVDGLLELAAHDGALVFVGFVEIAIDVA